MSVPRSIFHAILTVGVCVLSALIAFSAWADFLEIPLSDGSDIDTYLYTPWGKGPYPAVIVLPVGGGMNQYSKDFSSELSSAGYVTLTVDYTTGGGWFDAKVGAAYDYLQKLPEVDPKRIGMVGFSRGGLLALQITYDWHNGYPPRPVRAIVEYYMGNILGMALPDYPPILFLHGDNDDTMGWRGIEYFCDEQRKMDKVCEYKIYENTTHSFTHTSSWGMLNSYAERDAYKRTVAFLNKYLKGATVK